MANTSKRQLVDADPNHAHAVPDDRSSTRDLRAITDDDLSALMPPTASGDPLARTGSVPKGLAASPSPSASGKFASVAGRALTKPKIVKRVVKKSAAAEPVPANEDTSADVTIARTYEEVTSAANALDLQLAGIRDDGPPPSSEVQSLADLLEGEHSAHAGAPLSSEVPALADLLEGEIDVQAPPTKEVDPLAELTDLLIAATASIADSAPAEREERTVMLVNDARQEHTVMLAHDRLPGHPAEAPSVYDAAGQPPATAPWSGATAPLPFAPVPAPASSVNIIGLPSPASSTRDLASAATMAEARDSAPATAAPAKPKRGAAPWIIAALAVGVAIGVVMMRQVPFGSAFQSAPTEAAQPAAAPVVAVPAGDEASKVGAVTATSGIAASADAPASAAATGDPNAAATNTTTASAGATTANNGATTANNGATTANNGATTANNGATGASAADEKAPGSRAPSRPRPKAEAPKGDADEASASRSTPRPKANGAAKSAAGGENSEVDAETKKALEALQKSQLESSF
ncbi:MAG: hypothetical protein KF894_02445 [Labilithrix sp.]|nr:hypothetical protein [Labilithrix sp.]